MSDRRGRTSDSQDRRRTSSRAPSRNRREPSRDRSRTTSLNPGPGSDNGGNTRYYPPPAGGRSGSGASSQPASSLGRGSANPSSYRSAPSVDLPVYVGLSDTTSKLSLLGGSSSSGSIPVPRRESRQRRNSTTRIMDTDARATRPHDLPPSKPLSSNPARPLTGSGGSGGYSDPTAPVVSYPSTPSWARGSSPRPPSTVSRYPDRGHPSASQSLSVSDQGDRTGWARVRLPAFANVFSAEPDSLDGRSSSTDDGRAAAPYTRDHFRAGYDNLPSEPRHPGELFIPANSSGLSRAQSRPSDYSDRKPRTESPYSQAAAAERRQSEQRSRLGGWPVRGASNPSIGQDFTQDSHRRLADVAGGSVAGWTGRDNHDPARVERNRSRQSSHEEYAEKMERERRMDEERQRRR